MIMGEVNIDYSKKQTIIIKKLRHILEVHKLKITDTPTRLTEHS